MHQGPAAHATGNEGMIDYMKNQLATTGSSLADLGNKAGSIAGESVNDVKNKVGSVSPGEVYNNVRVRVQSTASSEKEKSNQEEEDAVQKTTSTPFLWNLDALDLNSQVTNCQVDIDEEDETRDHELIDNMEREKIVEFLQEKHKSNSHLRSKKK